MTNTELAAALRRIALETGSLVCLACGHEHNCGIHGCALLHEAAEVYVMVFQALKEAEERRKDDG